MCQETPLHMAARSGNVQVAQLLVSHGADVNALNLDDLTPLVIAAQEGKQAGHDPARSPEKILYRYNSSNTLNLQQHRNGTCGLTYTVK